MKIKLRFLNVLIFNSKVGFGVSFFFKFAVVIQTKQQQTFLMLNSYCCIYYEIVQGPVDAKVRGRL